MRHNNSEAIIIKENHFKSFVNFHDCWFTSEIFIEKNFFESGTNLCSKTQFITFDAPLYLLDNSGTLAIEGEGRDEY